MIDLNLDFDDEVKLPSQSRKNSQQKNKNRKELMLAKRKKQKAQYERKKAKASQLLEKHGMLNKVDFSKIIFVFNFLIKVWTEQQKYFQPKAKREQTTELWK